MGNAALIIPIIILGCLFFVFVVPILILAWFGDWRRQQTEHYRELRIEIHELRMEMLARTSPPPELFKKKPSERPTVEPPPKPPETEPARPKHETPREELLPPEPRTSKPVDITPPIPTPTPTPVDITPPAPTPIPTQTPRPVPTPTPVESKPPMKPVGSGAAPGSRSAETSHKSVRDSEHRPHPEPELEDWEREAMGWRPPRQPSQFEIAAEEPSGEFGTGSSSVRSMFPRAFRWNTPSPANGCCGSVCYCSSSVSDSS